MNRLSEAAVAGLLTVSTLSTAGCTEHNNMPGPAVSTTTTTEHRPATVEGVCPAPSKADIKTVEDLFDAPPLDRTDPYSHLTYDKKRQNIVAHLGLKMPNHDLVDVMDGLEYENRPYSDYYSTADHFFGELGVTLSIAKPGELSPGTDNVPTNEQLMSHASKYEIRQVVDGLSLYPTQLIEFSGLKRVILAANTGDYAYANVSGDHDTIVVDVANLDFAADLGTHELEHLIDAEECGGVEAMYNDPAFAALNEGKDIYTKDAEGKNLDAVTNSNAISNELQQKMLDALNSHDHVTACSLQETINERRVKVVANSDYALTNVVEDKAETGKDFAFDYNYRTNLNRNIPIVRNKFLFLMARLYGHLPNVVKFFAATSSRPADDPFNVKC